MAAKRFQIACFSLLVIAISRPIAIAQDQGPVVHSEPIGSAPFQAHRDVSCEAAPNCSETSQLPPIVTPSSMLPVSVDRKVEIPKEVPVQIQIPPHLGIPGNVQRMESDLPDARSSARILQVNGELPCEDDVPPAPLRPMDSAMFAESAAHPDPNAGASNAAEMPELRTASAAHMPRMTKMFSFNTVDKVSKLSVVPAFSPDDSALHIDMSGPEAVVVNQVFEQMVRIKNAGSTAQHDVRVTQECDLAVLGADQEQAVTIDCLEPGETRTVRFSTRAQQPGQFSVRYVAENAAIQADVNEVVEVSEDAVSIVIADSFNLQAGDCADLTLAIQNSTARELADVTIRCETEAAMHVQLYERGSCPLGDESALELKGRTIMPRSADLVGVRVACPVPGSAELEIIVESSGQRLASKRLSITVTPQAR